MRSTVLMLILLVGLVPALSGTAAEAAPGPGGSFVPPVHPGGTFLQQAWGFISCFWSKEGSSFDPLGAPLNKEGSSYDPLGAPSPQGPAPTQPVEAGSGFDPLGAPNPVSYP